MQRTALRLFMTVWMSFASSGKYSSLLPINISSAAFSEHIEAAQDLHLRIPSEEICSPCPIGCPQVSIALPTPEEIYSLCLQRHRPPQAGSRVSSSPLFART